MRIFITGIAGFLGSHLADRFIADGHEVRGNDTLLLGDKNNIPRNTLWSTLDCREFANDPGVLKDIDVLYHCAATAHEGVSSFSPSFITKNIFEASVSVFSAAIQAGVKRIVFMSSMARYGKGSPPFSENHLTAPVDCYGIAKVGAEDCLKNLAATHGVQYSILVPHNIIGTRQIYNDPGRNVASIMMNRCLKGLPPIIYGDGLQQRCFSPVRDCLHSIAKTLDGVGDGEVINIGPDNNEITILELTEKIMKLTDFRGRPIHFPDRPNEVKVAHTSSDKARRLLGFEEQQGLDGCLEEMVEDIKRQGTKEFNYFFPIEIEKGCPETWKKRLI